MLVNYKTAPQQQKERSPGPATTPGERTPPETTGLTFAQTAAAVPGTDGLTHAHVTCFDCQGTGHYANVQLVHYHAPIWWGAILLALGLFYDLKFKPGRK